VSNLGLSALAALARPNLDRDKVGWTHNDSLVKERAMRLLVVIIAALVLGAGASAQESHPRLVKRVRPVCTDSAKQAALDLSADLDIAIDEKGIGTLTQVRPPLNYGMGAAVREAVSQWHWKPSTDNSGTVPTNVTINLTVYCRP
jgi:hypothetical protein